MHDARFFSPLDHGNVRCELCPHFCVIQPGRSGRCQVRRNEDGLLRTLNYGEVAAVHVDPIEKKPLYHFLPGTEILSLGNNGCNFRCVFCQNWQISQTSVPTRCISPRQLLESAREQNMPSVAFTYAEPTIWFEYIADSAALLQSAGIHTVLVTNGFINPEPLETLIPLVSAMNVDIKSMDDDFYQRLCKGSVFPVLETCRRAAGRVHLEITNLIIPGENDSEDHFHALGEFVAEELGSGTPLHLSRYHPAFQMDHPATPSSALLKARDITSGYLNHVFLGNIWSSEISNDSICPGCNTRLIDRSGIRRQDVSSKVSPDGRCLECGESTGIVPFHA